MPSITSTAVKTEKVQVLDVPESFKSATTVIEKKCRNLEKRKLKLDGYREELAKGRTLSDEQQQAANRYNEVVANLELTREFITAFEKIGIETSKEEKKRKKQEVDERKQQDLTKLKELFSIQEVFNCLLSNEAREEFLHGVRGAPTLTENELKNLDTFFNLVSINRLNLSTTFNDAISCTANHFQLLLEGRNKPVAGTTYRELRNLVLRIIQSGYFDWKPQPEVIEPEPEPKQTEVIMQEERNREVYHNEQAYNVDTGMEYIEPPAVPLPTIPLVGQVPAPTYFPVDVETDFNFIQESLIDTKPQISSSVPMVVPQATTVPASLASMDSAVVMVHSQLPHLPYPFMAANPAAASIYAAAAHAVANPLVGTTSPAMQNAALSVIDVPTSETATTMSVSGPTPVSAASAVKHHQESQELEVNASNSAWAEEPQDDGPPFNQQEHSRTESNTWTNSSYRSSNTEDSGARRNYRGRGAGGYRGGQRGGNGGYYNNNSRYGGDRDRQGNGGGNERNNYQGERNYQQQQQDRYQNSNGGGASERNGTDRGYNNRYQGNGGSDQRGGEGRNNYQGNQQQQQGSYSRSDRGNNAGNGSYVPRGNYNRGGQSQRGAPRGSSRGGTGNATYENRNASSNKDQ